MSGAWRRARSTGAAVLALAACLVAGAEAPVALLSGGASFVPLRYLGEWLGASVSYDGGARRITCSIGKRAVALTIGKRAAIVGAKRVELSAPPFERKGTTYVPLRFVSEAFGARVAWNAAARQVSVVHPRTGQTLVLSARDRNEASVLLREMLRPNVRIIPADGSVRIEAITSASVTLSGAVPALRQDDIIADENGEKLLRRVVAVERLGQGRVLVRTVDATLDEMLTDAAFSVDTRYTAPGGRGWREVARWSGPGDKDSGRLTILGAAFQVSVVTDDKGTARPDDIAVTVYDRAGRVIGTISRTARVVTRQYRGPGEFSLRVRSRLKKWTVLAQEYL